MRFLGGWLTCRGSSCRAGHFHLSVSWWRSPTLQPSERLLRPGPRATAATVFGERSSTRSGLLGGEAQDSGTAVCPNHSDSPAMPDGFSRGA